MVQIEEYVSFKKSARTLTEAKENSIIITNVERQSSHKSYYKQDKKVSAEVFFLFSATSCCRFFQYSLSCFHIFGTFSCAF